MLKTVWNMKWIWLHQIMWTPRPFPQPPTKQPNFTSPSFLPWSSGSDFLSQLYRSRQIFQQFCSVLRANTSRKKIRKMLDGETSPSGERKGKEKKRVWYSFLYHTPPLESRTRVHCGSGEHSRSPRSPRISLAQRPTTRHTLLKTSLKAGRYSGETGEIRD